MTESDPVLDMRIINELHSLLEEGIGEIFIEYIENTKELLISLTAAAENGDLDAIRNLAHTLKGSSGNLGVSRVYRLSEAIEQDARDGCIERPLDKVRGVEGAFIDARETLQQVMTQLKRSGSC